MADANNTSQQVTRHPDGWAVVATDGVRFVCSRKEESREWNVFAQNADGSRGEWSQEFGSFRGCKEWIA